MGTDGRWLVPTGRPGAARGLLVMSHYQGPAWLSPGSPHLVLVLVPVLVLVLLLSLRLHLAPPGAPERRAQAAGQQQSGAAGAGRRPQGAGPGGAGR